MSRLLGLVSQYASRFWSEGERDAGLGGGGGGGKGESFLRSLFSQSKRDVDAEHHFELYTVLLSSLPSARQNKQPSLSLSLPAGCASASSSASRCLGGDDIARGLFTSANARR